VAGVIEQGGFELGDTLAHRPDRLADDRGDGADVAGDGKAGGGGGLADVVLQPVELIALGVEVAEQPLRRHEGIVGGRLGGLGLRAVGRGGCGHTRDSFA
jgi:hypothetical protein